MLRVQETKISILFVNSSTCTFLPACCVVGVVTHRTIMPLAPALSSHGFVFAGVTSFIDLHICLWFCLIRQRTNAVTFVYFSAHTQIDPELHYSSTCLSTSIFGAARRTFALSLIRVDVLLHLVWANSVVSSATSCAVDRPLLCRYFSAVYRKYIWPKTLRWSSWRLEPAVHVAAHAKCGVGCLHRSGLSGEHWIPHCHHRHLWWIVTDRWQGLTQPECEYGWNLVVSSPS